MTKIRVETNEDSLCFVNNKIHAIVGTCEYIYPVEAIEKIVMLTTDIGPFYDDVGLAVDVGNNTAIFIMSEYKCYKDFLFEQIGKILPLDYQKIIEASTCTDNNVFEIYIKN